MTATAVHLSEVQTAEAFMVVLRDYRALRGQPGSRLMAERCHQAYTATPIAAALAADSLPKLAMLRAILDGLQAGIHDRDAFTDAWYRLGTPAAELTGGSR